MRWRGSSTATMPGSSVRLLRRMSLEELDPFAEALEGLLVPTVPALVSQQVNAAAKPAERVARHFRVFEGTDLVLRRVVDEIRATLRPPERREVPRQERRLGDVDPGEDGLLLQPEVVEHVPAGRPTQAEDVSPVEAM